MIHKEGYTTLAIVYATIIISESLILYFFNNQWFFISTIPLALFILFFFSYFFRNPQRDLNYLPNTILAPADGKVVAIEETHEDEYLKDKRIQVSIFMSAWDIHKNLIPIEGEISYYKYHAGKYLLAINPKSSTLNERTSIAVKTKKHEILLRQIAGFMARRVVCYMKEGIHVKQNQELGFIKFGSRVDVFLPLGSEMKIKVGQKVKFGVTEIAVLP
ncbi:MAG: phosphatidylserine decarboxylase family protein [Bacteroidales bacterium]|nr:phosphatidylserine decarboxylase family protein [Bacteroidales bacterium]